jgi:O-antigen/teichoic acid export membrane protein
MMSIMWLVANLISNSHDVIQASYILSIALIPYSLTAVSQSVCRAFERVEYITISEVSANAFKVVLGLFVLYQGYGLVTLMVVLVASHFIMFSVSLYFALKCIPVRCFEFDLNLCRWIIKATPVFAIIFILNTVRWNIDILMLTRMMGEREVGFYSAASKLLTIGKMGISCYIVAIQPIIFRLYRTSLEKYRIVWKFH